MSDLVERLRERVERLESSTPDAMLHFMNGIVPLQLEAAAELTRLTEWVKELEATAWKYLQEVGEKARCIGETERKLDAANSTIAGLQRERDEARA